MKNYWKMRDFSLFSVSYAYVDHSSYQADRLFLQNKVRMKFKCLVMYFVMLPRKLPQYIKTMLIYCGKMRIICGRKIYVLRKAIGVDQDEEL